jgi:ketosteroid isomerase-like protein
MKKQLFVVLFIFMLCFSIACQKQGQEADKAPKANVEADGAAIKALLNEWVQLYNAEDFDKLISVFYAENPILMTPNESIRKGKEAILLSYQKDSESNIEHVDSSVAKDVRVSGNLAVAWGIDTGTTASRGGGKPVPYDLKWLMVFERQPDGIWKCLYEIWNDNPPAQQKSGSVEQELLKLEQDWNNAIIRSDWAFLDSIWADDSTETDSEGVIWTKAQSLASLKSGGEIVTSMVPDDMKVRVYGDAAVVTGRLTMKSTFMGKDNSDERRWTDTWIRKAGRWQCVATQSSKVAGK